MIDVIHEVDHAYSVRACIGVISLPDVLQLLILVITSYGAYSLLLFNAPSFFHLSLVHTFFLLWFINLEVFKLALRSCENAKRNTSFFQGKLLDFVRQD